MSETVRSVDLVIDSYKKEQLCAINDKEKLLQSVAAEKFCDVGFPTQKHEEWRFFPLGEVSKVVFKRADKLKIDCSSYREEKFGVVFVNGHLLEEAVLLPEGVEIFDTSNLDFTPLIEENRFAQNPMLAFSYSLFEKSYLLRVDSKAVLDSPIEMVFVTHADKYNFVVPKVFVEVGDVAEVTFVEKHVGGGISTLSLPIVEVSVGKAANVTYVRVCDEERKSYHFSYSIFSVDRDANLSAVSLDLGSIKTRHDLVVMLVGEGASASVDGVYLPRKNDLVGNYLLVEHRMPHTTSHELYKGVLQDSARSVFKGLIHVFKEAQKTDAIQENRNILLSNEALAHSLPQLLIFADDVKCTHASTIGRLDEEAIFYMRSRGVKDSLARSLMVHAFCLEVIERVSNSTLRNRLDKKILSVIPNSELIGNYLSSEVDV